MNPASSVSMRVPLGAPGVGEPDSVPALTVSQLNRYVAELFQADELLVDAQVRGEISNFKHHTSGHMYFTLKDEHSQLRCAMFRGQNLRLRFRPEDGQRVVARGNVGVYEKRGEYQLYVTSVEFDGVGALFEAFEKLKKKLQAEGLFNEDRKQPLPRYPGRIGVITSVTGAAVKDVCRVLRRRFPAVDILILPTLVQGEEAPESIVRSLELAHQVDNLDVLIVGRGGGSLEDLWAFNDERVARAVAAAQIPIISAVGHETDFTILDFVADVRAPTPSAAAEMAVPDREELQRRILRLSDSGVRCMSQMMVARREKLQNLVRRHALTHPRERIRQYRQTVDDLRERLARTLLSDVRLRRESLKVASGRLLALDPKAVLQRGYAIFRQRETGSVITSVDHARKGDLAEALLRDGIVPVIVDDRQG